MSPLPPHEDTAMTCVRRPGLLRPQPVLIYTPGGGEGGIFSSMKMPFSHER